MDSLALIGSLSFTVLLVLAMFAVYFMLIFFLGLMFYYFTGKDRPGKSLLAVLMRVGSRGYAHMWMFLMTLSGMIGFALFTKSILGALFEDFVYATSRYGFGSSASSAQSSDLQTGLVLFVLSIIIYLVHWAFAYLIETKAERAGTVVSKLFGVMGLFVTSLVFFGSLIIFVFELVAGAQAGGTLAWVFGSFPFWIYYALRAVWTIKNELGEETVEKKGK